MMLGAVTWLIENAIDKLGELTGKGAEFRAHLELMQSATVMISIFETPEGKWPCFVWQKGDELVFETARKGEWKQIKCAITVEEFSAMTGERFEQEFERPALTAIDYALGFGVRAAFEEGMQAGIARFDEEREWLKKNLAEIKYKYANRLGLDARDLCTLVEEALKRMDAIVS